MPTWTSCSGARRRCRTNWTPPAPGTSIQSSRWRWMRCDARRPKHRSRFSPAARNAASRCAACCCRNPTFFCSTSRRTISMPNRSSGSRNICSNMPAQSSRSRTIATSSTTSRDGSSSSIAVTAFRSKETIRRGSNRKRRDCNRKRNRNRSGRRLSSASWNGSACRPRDVTRKEKRASTLTSRCYIRRRSRRFRSSRSTSRPARASDKS